MITIVQTLEPEHLKSGEKASSVCYVIIKVCAVATIVMYMPKPQTPNPKPQTPNPTPA